MQKRGMFVFLIILMLSVIVLGVLARNQMVNSITKNQKYIDEYVKQYDGDFVYSYSETLENGTKRFYYKSEQYPDFVLTIDYSVSGSSASLSDNYETIVMQQKVVSYWKEFFGEQALVSITNCSDLNILTTIDDTLSYNAFDIVVGLMISDDIDDKIDAYVLRLQDAKIDCSIYFYHLNSEDYKEYSNTGFDVSVDKFENYTMFIIRNGKIDTKIQYE
jgi:hypothetical protein